MTLPFRICLPLLFALNICDGFNSYTFSHTTLSSIRHNRCHHSLVSASSNLRASAAPTAQARVVVTDMDETLISRKSTSYVITFLILYRAFLRLLLLPFAFLVLQPLSKISRSAAVKGMYYLAFRGVKVSTASEVAKKLQQRYAEDMQDPAASAILGADRSIVITASPDFMARPWLQKYLGIPDRDVFGAVLEVKGDRYTGRTLQLPIGDAKVDVLEEVKLAIGDAHTTGYGDHPTDLPFMYKCDKGVLVHPISPDIVNSDSITYEAPSSFDLSRLPPQAD